MINANYLRKIIDDCNKITPNELVNLISEAKDKNEIDFFMQLTDLIMQYKQKKTIEMKLF